MDSALVQTVLGLSVTAILSFPFIIGVRRPGNFQDVRLIYEFVLIFGSVVYMVGFGSYWIGTLGLMSNLVSANLSAEIIEAIDLKEPEWLLHVGAPLFLVLYCGSLRVFGLLMVDQPKDDSTIAN